MRKKDDTLRDTLLGYARDLADTEGVDAINIRTLAGMAGVATGTVYNYFSGKDEILLALTEVFWKNTLMEMRIHITADSFCGQLEEIYGFLRARIDQSAGKLMNSLGNVEAAGQERMASMQKSLEAALILRMDQDPDVRRDIWDAIFTKEAFVHFIMMNLMMLLKTGATDIGFFLIIVKRTIY